MFHDSGRGGYSAIRWNPYLAAHAKIPGTMRAVLLAIALLGIAACATTEQREVTRIGGVAASDALPIDACWRKAQASPQHQALRGKMGEYADSPTAAQKASPQKATPAEAAELLSLRRDYLMPCRKMALESAGKVHPVIVAILAENYAKVDANYAGLAARGTSWGAFVTENQTLVTERRAQLLAAGESLQQSLGKPQAAETERETAAAALEAWARRQQTLLPNQPVMSCRYAGLLLGCSTE